MTTYDYTSDQWPPRRLDAPDEFFVMWRRGKSDDFLSSFFPSMVHMSLCGAGPPDVLHVRIRERVETDPESPYWGWLKTGEDRWSMIQPSLLALSVCFLYGIEAAEKRGHGRHGNLVAEILYDPITDK